MKNPIRDIKDRIKNRIELRDAYVRVFTSDDGKKVLQHMGKSAGVFTPGVASDPNMQYYKLGYRDFFLQICKLISKDPSTLTEEAITQDA